MRVRVELRSVNSRFLEVKLRQPFGVAVEHELRRAIEARLGRGRVDVSIRLEGAGEGAGGEAGEPGSGGGQDPLTALGIERERIDPVLAALTKLADAAYQASFQVSHPTSLDLLKFLISSGAGKAAVVAEPSDEAPGFLGELVDEALARLVGMREREGESLAATLSNSLNELEAQVREAERALVGEPARIARPGRRALRRAARSRRGWGGRS